MSQSVDELVNVIAAKVAAQLNLAAPGNDPGTDPNAPCDVSAEDCNGCGFCHTRKPAVVEKLITIGADRIAAKAGGVKPNDKLNGYIDHTLLKPDATYEELSKVAEEARKWNFATVCVNASNIPLVAKLLSGSSTKPIAVVGFPLGAMTPQAKAFEAREAVRAGAKEIDMVINIGALKSKDYALVADDICRVVAASKPYGVKVIIEAANLNHDEKVIACALSKASGAAFVKTSTGFGGGGATVDDVALMRAVVGNDIGVKASGGVRDSKIANSMIEAGANRIGASASIAIVTGKKGTSSY